MAAKNITILGIDTSCDDTAVSLLKVIGSRFEVLSNVVSSQVKIHRKYGGIYPFLAKREHQRNLVPALIKSLKEARLLNSKFKIQNSKLQLKIQNLNKKIDLIGVTIGPGLEPCLWQGINFAKGLAEKYKKPLIPVNHVEAHIIANFIRENPKSKIQNPKFPAICLVVSGGHTQLILMRRIGKYKLIGETRDDAAGECFDKVARILGLGYPGGPAIDAAAAKFKTHRGPSSVCLPRPMLKQKNYDFSFSGLKTAVLYKIKNEKCKMKSESFIRALAAETQQAIIDVLIYKTLKAARDYKAKSIVLGGGVAASQELRKQFKLKIKNEKRKINFLVPEKILCTDNAAMVAVATYFHRQETKKDIRANANLRI